MIRFKRGHNVAPSSKMNKTHKNGLTINKFYGLNLEIGTKPGFPAQAQHTFRANKKKRKAQNSDLGNG